MIRPLAFLSAAASLLLAASAWAQSPQAWADPAEAMDEYGLDLVEIPEPATYDGILLAVAHDLFRSFSGADLRALGCEEHVLYDLKHVLSSEDADIRL